MTQLRLKPYPPLPTAKPAVKAQSGPLIPLLDKVCINAPDELIPSDWQKAKIEDHRAFNRRTAAVLAHRGYTKEAGLLSACGQVLRADVCGTCNQGGKLTVGKTYLNHCHQYRLCPICAGLERRGDIEYLTQAVDLINQRPISGHAWRKAVFTVKTNGDYLGAVRTAQRAFKRVWERYLKTPNAAAFMSIEFGPKTGNVHAHVLLYCPYVAQPELSAAWLNYTGDSWIVRVSAIPQSGMRKAIAEQVKYITKFGGDVEGSTKGMTPKKLVDVWQALRGKRVRLSASYGLFRRDVLERRLEVEAPKKGRAKDTDTEPQDLGLCICCGDRNWQAVYPNPDSYQRVLDKIPKRRVRSGFL